MKKLLIVGALVLGATPALAAETLSTLPSEAWTVSNYYKQDVYDKAKNSVGKIDDVLIDKSGKITAVIVGVGGFIGVGEKDVALPFAAITPEKKDNKWYLTVDQSKDGLKSAKGYKYDSASTTWVADTK